MKKHKTKTLKVIKTCLPLFILVPFIYRWDGGVYLATSGPGEVRRDTPDSHHQSALAAANPPEWTH